MVLLVITPLIRSALESLPQPTRDETSLPDPASSEAISHTQLITLSQKLCSPDSDDNTEKREDGLVTTYTLNSLLRGTKLYISPPPPRPAPVCQEKECMRSIYLPKRLTFTL